MPSRLVAWATLAASGISGLVLGFVLQPRISEQLSRTAQKRK